jgi:hypothetical protein
LFLFYAHTNANRPLICAHECQSPPNYSLVYALKKFKYDPDCDLFLGCLEKWLPQDLRSVQPVITNEVLASCRKRDLRVHRETLGYLSLDELLRALKDVKIFLYKSDEAFLALQVTICVFSLVFLSHLMAAKFLKQLVSGFSCSGGRRRVQGAVFEIPAILWLAVL